MSKIKNRFAWMVSTAILCWLSFSALLGQEGGAVFEQPEDAILHWAERACLVVLLGSVALILYVLIFRRDRLAQSTSKWLLFFGLVGLPVPAAFLSAGVGMEESKAVEFCQSCHAPMDPFVDDMMDPDSELLAALHYKNRYMQGEHCWNCHSDYGIGGTIEAKMTGLLHIYKYTTNTWHAPIELYNPYKWTICLDCHASSALFRENEDHMDNMEGFVSGETGCTDCHDMAHPEREERSTKP